MEKHNELLASGGNGPDIGIIANSTSPLNRIDLVNELGQPHDGFFNPLKFSFRELKGEIIPLDIQPNDILQKSGMAVAKEAMYNAVAYLANKGVKVIVFTASTKRLPGKFGQEVKKLYPDIIFSIGDNATMISYFSLIDHYISEPNKKIGKDDEIVCLGAGFLGLESIARLLEKNPEQKITLVSEQSPNMLPLSSRVRVINDLSLLPLNIKMFMSCSHKYQIDPHNFKKHLSEDAVILDVAVPPGIGHEVYETLPSTVSRFDAGDFFLDDIKYDFDPKILCFPSVGFFYGCFTEGVMLALALKAGEDLKKYNFFEVSLSAREMLTSFLKKEKVFIPLINFYRRNKDIEFISF